MNNVCCCVNICVVEIEGQIVYGFDGATYDLKQVVLLPDGADESSAVYFTVDSIGEADDSLLAVPDLSAYTKE